MKLKFPHENPNPLFCLLFLLFLLPTKSFAQLTKVVDHGPDNNRVVFVFVGDGFSQAEQVSFNADVDSVLYAFSKREPWKTYWSFLNFYRINVSSLQSGISRPGNPLATPFGSGINSIGLYLRNEKALSDTITKYLGNISVRVFAILNAPERSGSGAGISLVARGDIGNVALHEMGHVFGLADEYVGSTDSMPPATTDEPNVTKAPDIAATGPHRVKWWMWLTPGIPMPTPREAQYEDFVGLYDGAKYTYGAYKPQRYCMMGNSQSNYCRICSEALVLKIHEQVRIDEESSPASTVYYNVYPTACSFSPLDTSNIKYEIRWYLDYTLLPNERSNSVTFQPWDLGQMPHILHAVITDTTRYNYTWSDARGVIENTRFVRNDPLGLMSDTLTWNLQYKLDGPNAVYSVELIAYSINGRSVSIRDKKAWELYSQRNLKIYDIQGRLLQTFSSNGIAIHNWQAPTAGVFFIRLNDNQSQTKKIVIR